MNIKYIVVHCSDTPNEREHTAADIHHWHQEKGWDGIGYNHVIQRNGKLEQGRPHYWLGAHVKGYNHVSIGICLIGRDQFTDDQMQALRVLTGKLLYEYPGAELVGHRDLDPDKTCPNFDVTEWAKGN